MSYTRPTDPAHPVHFDFLYKVVSILFWGAGTLILATIGITGGVVGWTIKRQQKIEPSPPQKTSELPLRHQTPPPIPLPEKKRPVRGRISTASADDKGELLIPCPEDNLLIHIRVEKFEEKQNCVLIVDNNRLDAISGTTLTIYSAVSFDNSHREYRLVPAVSDIRVDRPDVIQPGYPGKSFLLVRKDPDKHHLFAGNNTANLMIWPENDKSLLQKWKLSASFFSQTWPHNSTSMPEPLTVIKFELVVIWDKGANKLMIEKG